MALCCFKCGCDIPLSSGEKVRQRDECNCGADLHCCMNCRHYDRTVNQQCRETQAEWVRYKEEWNRCEYFEPAASTVGRAGTTGGDAASAAKKKFDDLFKL